VLSGNARRARAGRNGIRLARLVALALFITFDLIMFGAFVRVSDAGLGCPDWPGCYGKLTPAGAMDDILAEATARPQGPVTVFKAWVEMLHRYVASALGLLIIWIAWLAWRQRPSRRASPLAKGGQPDAAGGAWGGASFSASTGAWGGATIGAFNSASGTVSFPLALVTLFWVILQGLFGMWTVTLRLQPAIVTAHLLGGMVLFALLLMQLNRTIQHPPLAAEAGSYRTWARLALALLFAQIALGGWVSSNYATLACQDFPKCQGYWWPEMDVAAGFQIWRPLGMTADGAGLPFPALTAIHYAHRLMAYVVLAVLGVLAWRVRRVGGLERIGLWLLLVLAMQVITGLTNIFLDWPAAAAVLHTGGATALVGGVLMLNFRSGAGRRLPFGPSGA
jgi:cytochrome c oxidase assembly protein subunit 15